MLVGRWIVSSGVLSCGVVGPKAAIDDGMKTPKLCLRQTKKKKRKQKWNSTHTRTGAFACSLSRRFEHIETALIVNVNGVRNVRLGRCAQQRRQVHNVVHTLLHHNARQVVVIADIQKFKRLFQRKSKSSRKRRTNEFNKSEVKKKWEVKKKKRFLFVQFLYALLLHLRSFVQAFVHRYEWLNLLHARRVRFVPTQCQSKVHFVVIVFIFIFFFYFLFLFIFIYF